MEKSKEELINGINELTPADPFPDEIFYRIFEIEDHVERTQFVEALKNHARMIHRSREFCNLLQSFFKDYQQKMMERGNVTQFTEQPVELQCGPWRATDLGVTAQKFDGRGMPVQITACLHPILPVEILKNVDNGEERLKLGYFKYGAWNYVTVNREVCADNAMIVKVLSKIGIEVTSENAKYLVRYISDCVGMNPVRLEPKRSINRLGWCGHEFMPYADDIVYDGDKAYDSIFRNVCEGGSYETWRDHCCVLRENKIVRMAFAASFGSVLVEPLQILPFVLHIWGGESGTCKTVAIMAAMSIWGNPKMGGLVKTMDATSVNVRRTAAFLYSLPYAGDELQTIKDNKYFTNYDKFIYQITEGVDRGRGKASGGVEETKTWHNSYLFTGEEPITKSNSRAGSKNRVIEIEAEEKLLEDGNYTVSVLTENYGHAGKRLIEYINSVDISDLRAEYKRYFDEICQLDTTEKQAMAMSCMLVADRILSEQVFGGAPLTIKDVSGYLRSAKEVDIAERSYEMVMNWIAKNPVRFQNPGETDSANKGEVWGRIDSDESHPEKPPVAIINKDVLCDFLERSGFDYAAVSKKWAAKERLIRNSQGKMVHQTKVYGVKASYIKLNMSADTDEDGFVDAEEEQMELPFD